MQAACVLLAVSIAAHASSYTHVVSPTSQDPDWQLQFQQADLLYFAGPRPNFKTLPPVERCGPTLRIAGLYSGFYVKNGTAPPVPANGFSEKIFSSRASIPAYSSSVMAYGPSLIAGSTRSA